MASYDSSGRSAAQRAKDAYSLHVAGASYDAIAEALHYRSKSGAYAAVQAEMRRQTETGEDDATTTVKLELARLDRMLRGIFTAAAAGNLFAIDRVIRLQDQRVKYLSMLNAATTRTPVEEDRVVSISRARDARIARAASQ